MRRHFQNQPNLHVTPIEKIRLPFQSRDELPPILAGLQWIWMHPTLKAEILALIEAKILAGKQATGRTGMDLWQILVLGVVRLGLDADWDRMEDLANHHLLLRQMLGLPATPWGGGARQNLRPPNLAGQRRPARSRTADAAQRAHRRGRTRGVR